MVAHAEPAVVATGMPAEVRTAAGWSGRRGSNPRPTAWKAVTLPLSYSRASSGLGPPGPAAQLHLSPRRSSDSPIPRNAPILDASSLRPGASRIGGQGRIRTSVALGAADLQSAAIDRSATCPRNELRTEQRRPDHEEREPKQQTRDDATTPVPRTAVWLCD
jgi:hypothetical protein